LLPPPRSWHPPRRPRASVSCVRQHRAPRAGHGVLDRAGHLPSGTIRRAHRGHRDDRRRRRRRALESRRPRVGDRPLDASCRRRRRLRARAAPPLPAARRRRADPRARVHRPRDARRGMVRGFARGARRRARGRRRGRRLRHRDVPGPRRHRDGAPRCGRQRHRHRRDVLAVHRDRRDRGRARRVAAASGPRPRRLMRTRLVAAIVAATVGLAFWWALTEPLPVPPTILLAIPALILFCAGLVAGRLGAIASPVALLFSLFAGSIIATQMHQYFAPATPPISSFGGLIALSLPELLPLVGIAVVVVAAGGVLGERLLPAGR